MSKAAFLFIFYFFTPFFIFAQTHYGPCGNAGGEWVDEVTERLLQNKLAIEENPVQFRSTVYIPVAFHLVANSNGQGRVPTNRVLEQLCALNQDFAETGMQFYIKRINDNINNTTIYNAQYNAGSAMNLLRDPAALNIWIVDVAAPSAPSPGDVGTILGYYHPFRDWVVMRRDEVRANSVTLPHEIGHFFSLNHTHNGWDSQPWTPAIGNPAPAVSPGGVPTELQNGSNCNTSGDYICDTPADYNGFGFNGCNYNIAQDPTGVFITPDEQLFMSYFLNCARSEYYFSETQQNLMLADYNQSRRNYLRTGFTPNLTEIPAPPTLEFPIGAETVPGYNSVHFRWTEVEGADSYLLEIDRVASFTINPIRVIVSGANSHIVTTLEPGRLYFWRVRPFSNYRTCVLSTPTTTFRTGTELVSVNEIAALKSWQITPNPVAANGSMQINLQAAEAFYGAFALFDVSGRQLRQYGRLRIDAGDSRFDFSVEGISPGIYILALDHEEGREVRRVVVAR